MFEAAKRIAVAAVVAAAAVTSGGAGASNISPLAFGMTPEQAAAALQSQLVYVRGRPGSEVFVTVRDAGVPGFYPVDTRIFLQFRRGHLTGWKKDWRVRKGWLF
jgi:hypothetical protein